MKVDDPWGLKIPSDGRESLSKPDRICFWVVGVVVMVLIIAMCLFVIPRFL